MKVLQVTLLSQFVDNVSEGFTFVLQVTPHIVGLKLIVLRRKLTGWQRQQTHSPLHCRRDSGVSVIFSTAGATVTRAARDGTLPEETSFT